MLDPSLTLKEGSKVKFDPIKRFVGHDFLKSGWTFLARNFFFDILDFLDTLWVKNFDEIALSRTVKEINEIASS